MHIYIYVYTYTICLLHIIYIYTHYTYTQPVYIRSIYPSETVYKTLDWMYKLMAKVLKPKPTETFGIFQLSWRKKEGTGLRFGTGGARQMAIFEKQSSPTPVLLLSCLDEWYFSCTEKGRTMKRLSVPSRHLMTWMDSGNTWG